MIYNKFCWLIILIKCKKSYFFNKFTKKKLKEILIFFFTYSDSARQNIVVHHLWTSFVNLYSIYNAITGFRFCADSAPKISPPPATGEELKGSGAPQLSWRKWVWLNIRSLTMLATKILKVCYRVHLYTKDSEFKVEEQLYFSQKPFYLRS